MNPRALFCAITLISCLGVFPQEQTEGNPSTTPSASIEFKYGDYFYTVLSEEEGTCQTRPGSMSEYQEGSPSKITYGNDANGDLVIPSEVTYENNGATKIYKVVQIGRFGFHGASSVTLPESLLNIDDYAFVNSQALQKVTIPNSVNSIGNYVFYGCSNLSEVILPETLTTIGNYTFSNCPSLTQINLPDAMAEIGNDTFSFSGLTSIDIPEGVNAIGERTFFSCTSLATAKLPSTLTTIGSYAFESCHKLTEIVLPANLSKIGDFAFQRSGLTKVECQSYSPPAMSENSFSNYNVELQVYKTAEPAYKSNNIWKNFANITLIPVSTQEIALDKSIASVGDGLSITLKAILSPVDATDPIEWSSSDFSVVEVNQQGKINGHKLGTAMITATSNGKTANCMVTVTQNPSTSVTITPLESPFYVGQEVMMEAKVKPSTITAPFIWSTANPEIATIDETGLLKGVAPGATLVIASCDNIIGKYTVQVLEVMATEVNLSFNEVALKVGESAQATYNVLPANTTYPFVTWKTNNDFVATVIDGYIVAVGVGEATITATCGNVSSTISVTVSPTLANSVELNSSSLTLKENQSFQFIANVMPVTTTDKSIVWKSSDETVASITMSGLLTTKSVGNALITATCGDVSATCNVTVEPTLPTEVVLNVVSVNMYPNTVKQLVATVGQDVTDKTIVWSSSNPQVATVEANGLVSALTLGETTITAKCGNVSSSCKVTVIPVEVTSVVMDKGLLEINVGESNSLNASVTPDNATDKTIVWYSDMPHIASVDQNGKVTGVGPGTATITANSGNFSAICEVIVYAPAKSITLSDTELTIEIGQQEDIIPIIDPTDTTDPIIWTSEDTKIVSVDLYGIVEGLSGGTTNVVATCGKVSAICKITVIGEPAPEEPETPDNPGTDNPGGSDNEGGDSGDNGNSGNGEGGSSGIDQVQADGNGNFVIFNLNGHHISTTKDINSLQTLPSGVYIINGKKILLKR